MIMLSLVKWFLAFQAVYHLLVVGLSYGGGRISQSTLAILRDGIWCLLVAGFLLFSRKSARQLVQARWKEIICYWGLVLFAVVMSLGYAKVGISDVLIGFKYGLRSRGIFLMAGILGYALMKKNKKSDFFSAFVSFLKWSLPVIVILGRVWQGAKLLFPDWFFAFGYGGLDDFHYGINPPLYYLTGFEGTLRWQGLFAGPNNYGYFLIAFLPVVLSLFPLSFLKWKDRKKADWIAFAVQLLWIVSLGATLSRAAVVGLFVVVFLRYARTLFKFKKVFFALIGGLVLLLGMLSVWKRESTLVHIEKKLQGFEQVFEAPMGYGLGSSGPAVHHKGKFLPENYYVQLLLDIGVLGFGMWLAMLIFSGLEQKKLLETLQKEKEEKQSQKSDFWSLLFAFQVGFLALLVMGLFLHVFEDSMVNYWFFMSYGLVFGIAKFLVTKPTR